MDEISIIVMVIATILSTASYLKYLSVKAALKEIVDALKDDTITKIEFVKIVLSIKRILY